MQRHRGAGCDPFATRLASIETQADSWWDSSNVAHDTRWSLALPGLADIKSYLMDTLETSLELLEKLLTMMTHCIFRLALFHEDMHGEALIYMAQTLGLPLSLSVPGPWRCVSLCWFLPRAGSWEPPAAAGFLDNERQAHEVHVPEFELTPRW